VQGVRGLMQYTMRKVPISDMTTVMTVVPKKVPGECEIVLCFSGRVDGNYFKAIVTNVSNASSPPKQQSRKMIGCE